MPNRPMEVTMNSTNVSRDDRERRRGWMALLWAAVIALAGWPFPVW